MRTLFKPMAAVVTVVAQQSQAAALANARRGATEASARRLERDEVAQFLQALATRGRAPAIVVAR
jgi:hypothetical protein